MCFSLTHSVPCAWPPLCSHAAVWHAPESMPTAVCVGLCRNLPGWKRRRRWRRKSSRTHFIRSFSISAATLSRRGGQCPRSALLPPGTRRGRAAPDLPLTDGCAGREGARSEQPSLLPYCWPSGAIWGNAISHALPSSCQARGVQTKQPESGTFLPEFHGKPVPIQIFRVVSQNRGRRGRREVPINSLVHVT